MYKHRYKHKHKYKLQVQVQLQLQAQAQVQAKSRLMCKCISVKQRAYRFQNKCLDKWAPCFLYIDKNLSIQSMVSDERAVKHLNPTLGLSLIASSAYQKWPT